MADVCLKKTLSIIYAQIKCPGYTRALKTFVTIVNSF
jgi:hypothetical protein